MKIVQITTDNREHYKTYDSRNPAFGAAPEALLDGFRSQADVEIHVISCLRRPVKSPERIASNIHYHSITVPKSGGMSTLYVGCIRAVRELLSDIQPDMVHGQGTERECALAAAYSGFPNVVTIHGNMAELNRQGINFENQKLFGFLCSRLETYALRKTAGVFCNSAYTESLVSPRAKRTWRVPNAIRAEFFRPATISPVNDIPIILNVGHLGVRKRQLEILQMAKRMHREGHCFKLIFAGALCEVSAYGRAFNEELKQAEASGYATHAGFLDSDALIDLMDHSHGFIHFPLEEAFGLVVAEAMARGLKFFGANLGGIKEIAGGIPGAELYDDLTSLQGGVSRWLTAGSQRAPESAASVRIRYAPAVVVAQHLEIYREVLNR